MFLAQHSSFSMSDACFVDSLVLGSGGSNLLSSAFVSLDSNFGAEPELIPKTPSQRRRPKKRRSSCLKDENKEPNRRR